MPTIPMKARHTPARPEMLSFDIRQIRRGARLRKWMAFSSGDTYDIGQSIDGTRREVAAKILEKIAKELRNGRHKPALIISITHAYLHNPLEGNPEIEVQVKALRELANELERGWNLVTARPESP